MPAPSPNDQPLPYRWGLLAILVIMSGLAALGFVREYWPSEDREGQDTASPGLVEELMAEFGYGFGDIVLVIEGDDLFRPDAVAATRALIADLEQTYGVGQVFSIDRMPREAKLLAMQPLLPPDGASEEEFLGARERTLAHPLVAGRLCDKEGKVWLAPVGLDIAATLDDWGEEFSAESLARVVADAQLPSDMRASLTGAAMLTWASEETFEYEQWLYHSIAYVLVFCLAALLFRGVWAVVLSGGGPVIGVIWSFGISKLLGIHLSSLTLILLPVMLMMIGFTDSVHLMVHLRSERGKGRSPAAATASALKLLALPCMLTSLTTGLGFASLLTARTDLVRDFGAACAVGVICVLLAVLSFLPFFASSFVGKYIRERENSTLVDGSLPIANRLIRRTLRHARGIMVLGVLVTAASGIYGSSIETENRVQADIPASRPAARALRVIDRSFGGSVPVYVEVTWDEELDGDWKKILDGLGAAQEVLGDGGEHTLPTSILDLLSFLAPGTKPHEAISMIKLLPKALTQSLYSEKGRWSEVQLQMPDRGYRYFEETYERWQAAIDDLATAHPGLKFDLGGQAIRSGKVFRQFTEDLVDSLALAALIIFGVLAMAFRSIRLGLISIIPNALPLTGTTAVLVALDMPMAGATALVMSLGIAVDDTIHFMTRFKHEYELDGDMDAAIQRSTLAVGKALLTTTVVLVVGFAAVMTSDFPRNRVFSGMICFSLVLALASDLILLPAMLKCVGPKAPRRRI